MDISGLIYDPIKMKYFLLKTMEPFNNHRVRVSTKNNIDGCLFYIRENKRADFHTEGLVRSARSVCR